MDSFGSFGLCEEALDYFVEVELPDLSTKKFQFFPRHTVDKIKSKIIGDSPQLSKTSPSDYFLCTTDNERIEIDFVRFIVSHPKITEILEKEPLVKVKLVNKQTFQNTVGSSTLYQNNQSSTSSSLNLQKEKMFVLKREIALSCTSVFYDKPTPTSSTLHYFYFNVDMNNYQQQTHSITHFRNFRNPLTTIPHYDKNYNVYKFTALLMIYLEFTHTYTPKTVCLFKFLKILLQLYMLSVCLF
ncbi:hypothetical protein DLAC_11558 [Tieghemostelium lacteum]|uniref:Uncharacterized protein n=1 Tax=Tieghemostelium lacteum TaxID=361077 RepID=A0A152A0U5_TIELA|nr:hypothetical protein DLAC_11558 [Tieghemostelium lacteum]|eukprot:KYQ99704.1 hypothetical protein DLAC_11558 [Tieghemostelium lacteum]